MSVSVVIPTYNRLWALPRSIAQFYDDPLVEEIIVVVDDSRDGTQDWLEKERLARPIVKPVVHPQNRGAPAARQSGVRAATCEYVLLWDDDMLLMPRGGLSTLLSELQRYQGDVIAPAFAVSEGHEQPAVSLPDDDEHALLASDILFNRRTLMLRPASPADLPRRTFESKLCYGWMLQRKTVLENLRFPADLGPTYFRDETDLHLQLLARGCRLLACPFVYALDMRRPAGTVPDGGCHARGTLLKYDLIACRNNWRVLKRHRKTIHEKLDIRLPLFALQAVFVADRLGYRTMRKAAGRILRALRLKR